MRLMQWGTWVLGIGLVACGASVMGADAAMPAGYRLAQQISVGGGDSLQVLEDLRITPELHAQLWGNSSDPDSISDETLAADVQAHPFLEAQARLVAASGEVKTQKKLGYPLATVEKAPFRGLPQPEFFLTIDETAPMGSMSGPATEVLVPAEQGLKPVTYMAEDGKPHELILAQTGKAAWQASPPDEIQQVSSVADFKAAAKDTGDEDGEGDSFVTTYRTYKFANGKWTATSRQKNEYWESEGDFPERSAFP